MDFSIDFFYDKQYIHLQRRSSKTVEMMLSITWRCCAWNFQKRTVLKDRWTIAWNVKKMSLLAEMVNVFMDLVFVITSMNARMGPMNLGGKLLLFLWRVAKCLENARFDVWNVVSLFQTYWDILYCGKFNHKLLLLYIYVCTYKFRFSQ